MLSFRPGSEVEQEQLGAALAPCCGAGSVLFLDGELGVGKTTLVRGFLRGMGYPDRVKSPTYTLIEPYAVGATNVYHLDLYRVGDPDELEFLGIRDLVAEESTLLVEWPERGEGMLPPRISGWLSAMPGPAGWWKFRPAANADGRYWRLSNPIGHEAAAGCNKNKSRLLFYLYDKSGNLLNYMLTFVA